MRVYGLDILRALAIIFVLIPHSAIFLPTSINNFVQRYCPDGVSLFFVLSGFLIGGILLKTEFSFKGIFNFWIRRWLRTLPAFYTTILLLILFYSLTTGTPSFKAIIKCLTFSQSLFKDTHQIYNEGWSLCVEEWFYLLIPIVLFFLIKILTKKKSFLITILSVIILSTVARVIRASHIQDVETWDNNIRRPVFFRLDSIMFGVLGAYFSYYKLWRKESLLFLIGLLILIFNQFGTGFYFTITLQSIGVLLLLPKLNSIKTGSGIIFKVVTFISIISYSLYLMNFTPFFDMVYPAFRESNLLFIIFYSWAFISAYLMYRLIEKPFMDMRKHFKYVPAKEYRA